MKLATTQVGSPDSSQKGGTNVGTDLRVAGMPVELEGYVTPQSLWAWLLDYRDFPEEHE